MPISRIYQPVSLAMHQTLQLDEKASHHLARVLRFQKGDHLIVFNGEGGEYTAEIIGLSKKSVDVMLTGFIAREAESPINIHLAQGVARGEKMDFIIQKAVELGVSSVTPLVTERSNVRLDKEREEKRMQHWLGVAVSACEQSGRNRVPQVLSPMALNAWLPQTKADLSFVLSPHVEAKLPDKKLPPNASIALLIGPEGGFSEAEVAMASQHGFIPLNLGPRILRTETATLAAVTAMQVCYGDLI